jgi:hypothetical protein
MPDFENADDLSYFLWKKKKKNTQRLLDEISYHDEPSINDLKNTYTQLIFIYDDIIDDASTQLNDSQYCETTSWSYEDKLKELEKHAEDLAPIVEKIIEDIDYQSMLSDIGMTHEEYQQYLEANFSKKTRKKF